MLKTSFLEQNTQKHMNGFTLKFQLNLFREEMHLLVTLFQWHGDKNVLN